MKLCKIVPSVLVAIAAFANVSLQSADEPGWRALFNGKDLTGWDGNPELWSVKEGIILGKITGPEQIPYNQFLIWRGGVLKNFEVRATIRQAGNNSGIQYRSDELKNVGPWAIGGYQCDIHPNPAYNGQQYHERGRGIIFFNGQKGVVDDKGQKYLLSQKEPLKVEVEQWHEYTVIAVGNKLTHKIDGQVVMEMTDHEVAKRALAGLLAIQIHRGPAMTVEIKEVRLKELPEGGVVTLAEEPLPADAKLVAPPKPRPAANKAKKKE
ncbi:MAG: DUF1080 domain-containing protein [Verrucomicrobiota bacterium]